MKNRILRSCIRAALVLVASSVPPLVACSSDSTEPAPAAGGAGGGVAGSAGVAGSGGNAGSGGVAGSGGNAGIAGSAGNAGTAPDGGGGTAGADAGPDAEGDADAGVNDPFKNPAYSIDTSVVPAGVAPKSCQLDPVTGRLAILLDAKAPVLLVGVVGVEIMANGVVCTTAGGVKATTENTTRIQVLGSAGNDTVILDLSTGSFGSKILSMDGGIDIDLAGGNDTFLLRGTSQKDTVRAGKGTASVVVDITSDSAGDIYIAGSEKLVFSLGPGADDFRGGLDSGLGSATDVPLQVFGDAGDDTIEGGSKDDELNGGEGEDLFDEGEAGNGDDIINGGLGKNTISYERRSLGVTATLCTSSVLVGCSTPACSCAADGQNGEKDTLVNLRHIIGGSGGDTLTGSSEDDVIEGRNGDDYLYGMAGADVLTGGPGADTLDGGKGADDLDCGAGDADAAVVEASDKVTDCELY